MVSWSLLLGLLVSWACWAARAAWVPVLALCLLLNLPGSVYYVDFEGVFFGHQLVLHLSLLSLLWVCTRVLLALEPGFGVVGVFAGCLWAAFCGLLWSTHVFDSSRWWSRLDSAEGASLGVIFLGAGLLHCRGHLGRYLAHVLLAVLVLGAWGLGTGVVEAAVVHQWLAWGRLGWGVVVGIVAVAGYFSTHCEGSLAVASSLRAGARPGARLSTLAAAAFLPYAFVAVAVLSSDAGLLGCVLLGCVFVGARPAAAVPCHALWAWAALLVVLWWCPAWLAVLPCLAQWHCVLWWGHLAGLSTYYGLLSLQFVPVAPSGGVAGWAYLSVYAIAVAALLLCCTRVRRVG